MKLNFTFDGNMSRDVLESYLSRAVTASALYTSNTLEDDLRVIARLGVKFLGRASGVWGASGNDELHFAHSKALADRVHAQDPEKAALIAGHIYSLSLLAQRKLTAEELQRFLSDSFSLLELL